MRATLSASHAVEAIVVRNDGDTPSVMQLEAVAWSQQDGNDVYVPTRDIIATPPIFTVKPGGSQVVRVGMRQPPDASAERAYRVYFAEVPPAPASGFQGLQVALRLGVPVFILPAGKAVRSLAWSARGGAAGEITVGLANRGTVHVQVSEFHLEAAGAPVATHKAAAYVLGGQSRSWPVKVARMPPAGTILHLVARTDGGEVKADIAME